ncbi:MAG: trehalose 2-sulfotransferase [Thermoleophilaceae bacterium]|nr:trehalose 2-sulfotransferase [Thermoleophilaceae bacterium]
MEIPGLPRPERSYLVCATPRSGSTLLCKALEVTGVAGHPEEFFEAKRDTGAPARGGDYLWDSPDVDLHELLGEDPQPPAPPYSSLQEIGDYREHLRRTLEAGTTPNGVFGAKIMWGHREDFLPLARSLPELARASERDLLAALFPRLKYVWVRRYDRPRQAVSLWKAIQTQSWRSGEERSTREPVYHFAAIDHLRQMLDRNDGAWGNWFEQGGVQPLEFRYRHIAADPAGSVEAVLDHLGIDEPGHPEPKPPLERQADATSEEWVERYVRERSRSD